MDKEIKEIEFDSEKINKIKIELAEAENVASEVLRSIVKSGVNLSREEVAYLLRWAGDDEDVDVESIFDENYQYHKLRTVGKIDCPVCGQELVRLDEDCDGRSRYWCDVCNIDIQIDDSERIPKIEEELTELVGIKMCDKMMKVFYEEDEDNNSEIESRDYNETHDEEASNLVMACSHIKFNRKCGIEINFTRPDGIADVTILEASSPQELDSVWNDFCAENGFSAPDASINMVSLILTDEDYDKIEYITESANQFANSIISRELDDISLVKFRNKVICDMIINMLDNKEAVRIPHIVEETTEDGETFEYIEDILTREDLEDPNFVFYI